MTGSALIFTAFNRMNYFHRALSSWNQVPELKDWHVRFSIDAGPDAEMMTKIARQFVYGNELTDARVVVRDENLGVLHHPWVVFEEVFADGFDFALRTEDDLIVSNDSLRCAAFLRDQYAAEPTVACVNLSSYEDGDPAAVRLRDEFNPLLWGTWKDRWQAVIGPTWDHDYSTNNGVAGVQAGWDWNLNTRVLPKAGLKVAAPLRSRVDNIGVWGRHSNPDTYFALPHFMQHYEVSSYTVS